VIDNQESKYFFFEKKKQKTFDYVEPSGAQGPARPLGLITSSQAPTGST
jgi:hypothetical protein